MPDWRSEIRSRLQSLRLSPERETEIVEEVAQHLDDRFGELMAMGRSESDAAAEAWRELEAADVLTREVARVERPRPVDLPAPGAESKGRFLSGLIADIRFAFRTLRKNPSFSIPVLLAMALSIGPTTAIVSISNWLLWRPLPSVQRPDELALVWFGQWRDDGSMSPAGLSYLNIHEVRSAATSLNGFAGVQEQSATMVIGDRAPEVIQTAMVSGNFFQVMGVPIRSGRDFGADDDVPPLGAPVVIVSDGLARSAFGGASSAIGQRLTLNRKPFSIIGVAPPGFAGINRTGQVQTWVTGATIPYLLGVPDPVAYSARGGGSLSMFVARLGQGFTWANTRLELTNLAAGLAAKYPNENKKFASVGGRPAVTPRVYEGIGEAPMGRDRTQKTVSLLLGVAGVLVVLGCANVANLMVFRASRREREVAVRKALGASASRLIQLQLTESWLLAFLGAAAGLGLAVMLKSVLQDLLFPMPGGGSLPVPFDARVFAITFGVASATGILAGVAPAWVSLRGQLTAALGRSSTRFAARVPRLRSGLAVVQLALSLTLLIGALLLVATVRNFHSVDLGFDPRNVTTMDISMPAQAYPSETAIQFWRDLQGAAQASGEFEAVSASNAPPFGGAFMNRIQPPGAPPGETRMVRGNGVSDTFFSTLAIGLVRGREFTSAEAFAPATTPAPPIIVNETLAKQLFGSVDVLGRTIRFTKTISTPERDLPIIGVARDSRESLSGEREPAIFLPVGPFDFPRRGTVIVRSSRPAPATLASIKALVARFDKNLPVTGGQPITMLIDRGIRQQRLFAWTLSVLGGLGFVLAALGVYGLVAQATAERSREFGIRIAIGASRSQIARLVFRFAATIAVIGTVAGVVLAYFGSRAVALMLFGITALDPRVYLVAIGALAAVVAAACAIPALRAMRVQPMDVLRPD
ncbi:MAG TPA: ADOP family duplicated permease [Vicinamibacterales bacterium]|nr:ADOP family duplicated permease [Vicinamibacterales bacterium]